MGLFQPNRGPAPWPGVHSSCRTRTFVLLCKAWPTSGLMIDSVIKANKKYCPQTLSEECKYTQEKIKIENYINDDLEKSESDSDSNNQAEFTSRYFF